MKIYFLDFFGKKPKQSEPEEPNQKKRLIRSTPGKKEGNTGF